MALIVLLTREKSVAADILPALGLLAHKVQVLPAEASSLLEVDPSVVLLDARSDLVGIRNLCRSLAAMGNQIPLLAIVTEGGLTALSSEWGLTDFVLAGAGPAEVESRLRLCLAGQDNPELIRSGGVEIDEAAYVAKLNGKAMDLTYTEFELLKFLAQHPGKVFSREQLLSDVWGYDYFGGTRTVDVHVRRLRAKLGDADQLIGTVRNVGYRFTAR